MRTSPATLGSAIVDELRDDLQNWLTNRSSVKRERWRARWARRRSQRLSSESTALTLATASLFVALEKTMVPADHVDLPAAADKLQTHAQGHPRIKMSPRLASYASTAILVLT